MRVSDETNLRPLSGTKNLQSRRPVKGEVISEYCRIGWVLEKQVVNKAEVDRSPNGGHYHIASGREKEENYFGTSKPKALLIVSFGDTPIEPLKSIKYKLTAKLFSPMGLFRSSYYSLYFSVLCSNRNASFGQDEVKAFYNR
ncbi:predicted protein [Histoplasma capsulatum H143]|uniref:Uncharacterized protein n=1 Tax=Ajellomyces capsulatus (strain H143) TaxID=544712 RepID=C6H1U1_AJECH|nr:predicted protein [Histoplasma capsulatum H143]